MKPEHAVILGALTILVDRERERLDAAEARIGAILAEPRKASAREYIDACDDAREALDRFHEVCDAFESAAGMALKDTYGNT